MRLRPPWSHSSSSLCVLYCTWQKVRWRLSCDLASYPGSFPCPPRAWVWGYLWPLTSIQVWDIKNKKILMDLPGHSDEVQCELWEKVWIGLVLRLSFEEEKCLGRESWLHHFALSALLIGDHVTMVGCSYPPTHTPRYFLWTGAQTGRG